MKKIIGILIVLFIIIVVLTWLLPEAVTNTTELPLSEEAQILIEDEELEIPFSSHLEYAIVNGKENLVVLDPSVSNGQRFGGVLTVFDGRGRRVGRLDGVAGFAPIATSSEFVFSGRLKDRFGLFIFNIETSQTKSLGIEGGEGGLFVFEDGEIYYSSNATTRDSTKDDFLGRAPFYRLEISETGAESFETNLNYQSTGVLVPQIVLPSEEESEITSFAGLKFISKEGQFFLVISL